MKPHKWPFSLEKAMKIPWNHTASRFPRGGPSQSPSCLSCLRQQLHEIPMKQIIQNHPCSNQIRSPCFMLRFHSIAMFHASIPFNRHVSCFDSIQSPRFMLRFHSIAMFHASIPFNRHVSCFDSIQSPCFMLRSDINHHQIPVAMPWRRRLLQQPPQVCQVWVVTRQAAQRRWSYLDGPWS